MFALSYTAWCTTYQSLASIQWTPVQQRAVRHALDLMVKELERNSECSKREELLSNLNPEVLIASSPEKKKNSPNLNPDVVESSPEEKKKKRSAPEEGEKKAPPKKRTRKVKASEPPPPPPPPPPVAGAGGKTSTLPVPTARSSTSSDQLMEGSMDWGRDISDALLLKAALPVDLSVSKSSLVVPSTSGLAPPSCTITAPRNSVEENCSALEALLKSLSE